MLFNSYPFIFLFLPAVLLVFFRLERYRKTPLPALWLVLASLGFYAYWRTAYLWLLTGSILFNYGAGTLLGRLIERRTPSAKSVLILAIAADLALLGYFKYTDFLITVSNDIAGTAFPLQHIVLPLAISFFTFNQIAFLVDVYQGHVHEHGFLNYALFIVFFPHLIAGPIVHHRDVIPQFRHFNFSFSSPLVSMGLVVFSVGLFKKVVLADNVAPYADAVFDAAAQLQPLTPIEAWLGALAYSLQLYFDFSGYSDMAVGGALLFGVRFPWNFDSPYKAVSIIDFWRRWHISLSQFLRDYVYIPLGGNRLGAGRRSWNIWLTMLVGGLWHGANWSFVLWGGLHGIYVVINHLWRDWRKTLGQRASAPGRLERSIGAVITFLAVLAGWVLFRADSVSVALGIYRNMLDFRGIDPWTLEPGRLLPHLAPEFHTLTPFAWVAALLAICWFTPSLKELMDTDERGRARIFFPTWRPTRMWAVYSGALAWLAIMLLTRPTEFLYYQF